MKFCSRCFRDVEISSIIERSPDRGICPICGATDVPLYDSETSSSLMGIFDNLLSVYTPMCDLPDSYPREDTKMLANILSTDWEIFSDISDELILSIVKTLAPSFASDMPNLFTEPVGIPEKYDITYLDEYSILHAKQWDDFVNKIKHENRFHTNLIDTAKLRGYCLLLKKEIDCTHRRFYRGRIAKNEIGYLPSEMGAPPPEVAADGRANSAGISRLYLSYDRETTLHEIRAAEYDYITIGTFKAMAPITVVDLTRINKISPFSLDVDCTALAINREHLQKINDEMSKTMRRNDSTLDYLPTQYICDFVMSITDDDGYPMFDGIEYQSAMRSSGANLAIFYPEKFKCTHRKTYEVTKLSYHKTVISK